MRGGHFFDSYLLLGSGIHQVTVQRRLVVLNRHPVKLSGYCSGNPHVHIFPIVVQKNPKTDCFEKSKND